MQFSFRHGAILFALIGGIGLAAAQKSNIVSSSQPVFQVPGNDAAADDVTGSLGQTWHTLPSGAPVDVSVAGRLPIILPLSDEERGRVHASVMKLLNVPAEQVADADIAIELPSSIPMQDFPESLLDDVPVVQPYKFVKLEDRIWLVSPATRKVVAEIPRYHLLSVCAAGAKC
jgi:hypothetical protein